MVIARHCPPWVRQTLEDSCWAAVLEAWSLVDPRLPTLMQQPLIDHLGEGPTGGITPERKIPPISRAYGLAWAAHRSGEAVGYIRRNLPTSHLFVAYSNGTFLHSVLVYRLRDNDVSFMDPYDGHYKNRPHSWLEAKGPFVMMRKP